MEDCRADAIGAINSYLRQLRDDKEMKARITLVTFDSDSIDTIRDRVPAKSCAELTAEEYQPRASTPLLDAVGRGAGMLDSLSNKDEKRILAVMTDGLENASREFTKDRLKDLLDRKQREEGWLVLYLGAGHDSWSQAREMGIHPGNVADFDTTRLAATADAMYARAKRYAHASAFVAEATHGGFTSIERERLKTPFKPAASSQQ